MPKTAFRYGPVGRACADCGAQVTDTGGIIKDLPYCGPCLRVPAQHLFGAHISEDAPYDRFRRAGIGDDLDDWGSFYDVDRKRLENRGFL